jgi:hypothetical protein
MISHGLPDYLLPSHQAEVLAEVPYNEVEDVEIGGPGLVKTGGGFVGGGFGVQGAVEGMTIASVLNALTMRTSIKTVVRIQGISCELFLLHTKLTPAQLRIEMSRPLAAIRSAQVTDTPGGTQREEPAKSMSPVEQLAKLADMLEKGLLTREEFDLMKATVSSWARCRGTEPIRTLILISSAGLPPVGRDHRLYDVVCLMGRRS